MFSRIPESLKQQLRYILYWLHAPFDWLFCTTHGLSWRNGWILRGRPLIRIARDSQIIIGERWVAVSISKYNGIGVTQPVNLTTYAPNSKIVIGNDVGMSGCTIHAMENVEIGNEVLIGSGVLIMDNDAHPIDPENRRYSKKKIHTAPVKIGDNVFLGARAIILKGVTIGDGSVIGAGSVVTKNIPPYVIAAGNPARVVGTVT